VNLLSNAIKFSPESSKISLYSKKAGDVFLFSIKDNGCGISKEDQLNLFNRFYRGSNVSNIEGSGLGLYIIGNYLENMKGKLDFKSKLNIGTKVKLSFNTVGEESATFYNTPA
jgi:signal transduction histidine kinase